MNNQNSYSRGNNNNYNNNNNNNCCERNDEIKEICEKIVQLQREAVREEKDQLCDRDFLGNQEIGIEKLNTRPVMVFTDDDKAWHAPIERNEDECREEENEKTCVLRVERVQDGTVTFRALKRIHGTEEYREHEEHREHEGCRKRKFKSTNSFITIRLANIAAIRCLEDTFVDICIR